MISSRWKTLFASTLFIASLTLAVIAAQAQAGPKGHGGPGGPAPLAMLMLDAQVHTALALSSTQEAQWSAMQTAEQNLRTQAGALHTSLDALIAAEVAKTTPDLVAIENATVATHQTIETAVAAISAQAVALYSTLNTGQQAIVITAAKALEQRAHDRPAGVPHS